MYADVLNWMYRNVLGLKNTSIGYQTCCLQPFFYAENCECEGGTETPLGKIKVRWEKKANFVKIAVEAPKEVQMSLLLPGKEPIRVASGKYEFALKQ